MRSHSSVVSSGYIEKLTLNGTFANASAKRALAGRLYAGFTPRTKAIGTAPERIRSTAAATSPKREIPSKPTIGSAGRMVEPTAPFAWLIAATASATSSALAPRVPARAISGLACAISCCRRCRVAAETPLCCAASAMEVLPVSALAMASSLPGLQAIH